MEKQTFPTWSIQPKAETFVKRHFDHALRSCTEAARFQQAILDHCGVRLRDLLDHIVIPDTEASTAEISEYGWQPEGQDLFRNSTGFFPTITKGGSVLKVYFRVEHVADFVKAMNITGRIIGKPFAPHRQVCVWKEQDVEFWAVQRGGTRSFEVADHSDDYIQASRLHQQIFRSRRREFDTEEQGFDHTDVLVQSAVDDLGKDVACDLFLRAEREYWMSRNYAGRVQKMRQDKFGLGWANQDHHTYDSSRELFYRNIRVLETLGFECRERFYAGADAGWGSQILEQPVLGSIIFADIDLAPEELAGDFAHNPLEPLPYLRRAGLWTALHGESMLQAGLNHLECMFDQRVLREQFRTLGIDMMMPFSNFSHLYQELTVGEWWPVNPMKVDALEAKGLITKQQADDFRLNGAIGSHFENLERNDGYKGFNQPGIDDVLRVLDPRKNLLEMRDGHN